MGETVGQRLEGGVENMGPVIKGSIRSMRRGLDISSCSGWITPEDGGKGVYFFPFSLPSFDPVHNGSEQISALVEEFSRFSEGQKVTFNRVETQYGYQARNLMFDTSKEINVLIPKTENAVVGILDSDNTKGETGESIEKLDEKFLEAVSEHVKAYYVKNYNPKFPKASLPQNQEMTLLLETIRQTNNINTKNKSENTLLSLVAYTNEKELLELLLSHPQIDVNTQNNKKNTPLMQAILKGRNIKPMIEPLLAHPAIDLEIRNNYEGGGATPLMTAERHLEWEKDESQKYHYIEAIELLKAKALKK